MADTDPGFVELDADQISGLSDEEMAWPVVDRQLRHHGAIFDTVTEAVTTPDGDRITRDWIATKGAVGIIALDEQDRVVLVRQYRHPVRQRLWEPPAGLLDVPGEDPVAAAARELAEEALLAADRWTPLVEVMASPGMTDERIQVFLARGLHPAPRPDGFVVEGEEAHMERARVPLSSVVAAILERRVHNPILVSGCLAAWAQLTSPEPVEGSEPDRSA